MCVPFVSSHPHAWMRPYYAAAAAREGFSLLAIPLQFAAVLEALAVDYPTRAAKLRRIDDVPSQSALLMCLSSPVPPGPANRAVELWHATSDSRDLRCIAVYLPDGIDLRLITSHEILRTALLRDGPAVQAKAEEWRRKAGRPGWV